MWEGLSGLVHQGGFLQGLDQLHHRHEWSVQQQPAEGGGGVQQVGQEEREVC